MASLKLLVLFTLFLAVTFLHARADVSVGEDGREAEPVEVTVADGFDSSAHKIQLDQLKSKIQTLESHISEKSQELKKKDELVAAKEKIIQDRLNSIDSLQTEIASLQNKGASDTQEKVGKVHARATELEKQVNKLKREIETQNREKVALETRVTDAEEQIRGLNSKLDNLKKVNEEQKMQIRKMELALRVAEEEMMKAKYEETSRKEELMEVHGAWLPPWLAVHWIRSKSFIETHWNKHGKPALELITQKTLETKAQAGKWAEPHVKTVKTKWIPAVKEQWSTVKMSAEPHVQLLTTKTVEVYKASKDLVTPHINMIQEVVDPYYQEAKKFSKPYIDQIVVLTEPHVDKVQVALKPYTKKVLHAYGNLLKSASTYHHQVQAIVQESLKRHELTRPFATRELEWFAASALLALPFILLARVFSAIFWSKKAKKPIRTGKSHHHARRKAKRGHPEK